MVLDWDVPPKWLPTCTTANVVEMLHVMLPLCLHGSRCILNAFYVNTDANRVGAVRVRVGESIGQYEAFRRINLWALNTLRVQEKTGVATETKESSSDNNDCNNDNDYSDAMRPVMQFDMVRISESDKWAHEMALHRVGILRAKWWQLHEAVFKQNMNIASSSATISHSQMDRGQEKRNPSVGLLYQVDQLHSEVTKLSSPYSSWESWSRWLLEISIYVAICYILNR